MTGRDCGLDERAPMCGVPHHAVDKYLNRLLDRGYKIAICEQVEDPAEAKGLVAREVVRVLTPGTQLDPDSLDSGKYSIICSIVEEDGAYGIAACDLSSGHFECSDLLGEQAESHLFDEIERFAPVEFVVNEPSLPMIISLTITREIRSQSVRCRLSLSAARRQQNLALNIVRKTCSGIGLPV